MVTLGRECNLYCIRGALQGVTPEGSGPLVSLNPFFFLFHYNTLGIHINQNKLQQCEIRPDIHQCKIGNTPLVSVVYVSIHHILWMPLKCVSWVPPHLTWEK